MKNRVLTKREAWLDKATEFLEQWEYEAPDEGCRGFADILVEAFRRLSKELGEL